MKFINMHKNYADRIINNPGKQEFIKVYAESMVDGVKYIYWYSPGKVDFVGPFFSCLVFRIKGFIQGVRKIWKR